MLDSSKLKEFADDNFKLDENGIKFSKLEGKGEIARHDQFLCFQQCFQKTCTVDRENQGLFGKGLKCTFKCRLQFVSIWTSLKFCRLVMG